MADIRVSTGLPATVGRPSGDGAKALALRAAQKAFFDAALNQAGGGAPVVAARPATPAVSRVPVTPVSPAGTTTMGSDSGPTRLLRPGSLLDIRV